MDILPEQEGNQSLFRALNSSIIILSVLLKLCSLLSFYVSIKIILFQCDSLQMDEVQLIKISADDGQNYLKIILQLVFDTSPLAGLYGSDLSPNRTFLVALAPGMKESFANVRLIFDCLDWVEFFRMCENHGIHVWVPVDCKMENILLGIGPHSSTFPSSRSHWSKNFEKSKPDEERTFTGLLEDAAKRESSPAALCHSVEVEPVRFLIMHPCNSVRDIFPPAQLHNLTLVVNVFVGYALQLYSERALMWLRAVKVSPNEKHGRSSIAFVGNECRTLVDEGSTSTFRSMLPPPEKISEVLLDETASEADKVVFETSVCLHLLVDLLEALNSVINSVTTPILSEMWESDISDFADAWSEFRSSYVKVRQNKDKNDVTPPRVHNIIVELPRFIRKHQHSLFRYNEHSFEAVHKQLRLFEAKYQIPSAADIILPNAERTRARSAKQNANRRSRSARLAKKKKGSSDGDYVVTARKKAPGKKQAMEAQQERVMSSDLAKQLLAMSPYDVKLKERKKPQPVKEKREGVRDRRIMAFNAFNSRKFPPDCIPNLRLCMKFREKPTGSAPWNKPRFAKFR